MTVIEKAEKLSSIHSTELKKSREDALYEAILKLKTKDECAAFFTDLCTPAEMDALKERWLIARLLDAGKTSYRAISSHTGASTTTIGRVARFLQQEKNNGYRAILERLKK